MKKITLFACLMTFTVSFSNIVVRDIADFTFANGNELDLDFNNDGTPEFSFMDQGDGVVAAYIDPANVNFFMAGTFESEYGWDIIKSLALNAPINANGVFASEGDAYINGFWANPTDLFPNGDSYVGTTFKIGANRYYGWILINATADVIKIKSYAYNNVANQSINAGQTAVLAVDTFSDFEFGFYPNPVQHSVTIKSQEIILSAKAIDMTGKTMVLKIQNGTVINTEKLPNGIYMLQLTAADNKSATKKLVKI